MSINFRGRVIPPASLLAALLLAADHSSVATAHPGSGSRTDPPSRQQPSRQSPPRRESHQGHEHGANSPAGTAARGTHGGQISASPSYSFEVVYQPMETRLYLFDRSQRPLSVRGLRGEAIMQVRGNPKFFRFPLEYAAPDPRVPGQECLVARVDVSRLRDGDMQVTFDLANLPFQTEPKAWFTQTFALSRSAATPAATTPISLAVIVAQVTDADRDSIARQRTCPVMDTSLGDHGSPVKLLVGGQPLFVCCKGCIRKVQKNPALYLSKVAQAAPGR